MINLRRLLLIPAAAAALLPAVAALADLALQDARHPEETVLPVLRTLARTELLEASGPGARRRFFRPVLELAEPAGLPFVWEDDSGTLAVGAARPQDAALCFSRLQEHPEARTESWVCGRGAGGGRWALGLRAVFAGGLGFSWHAVAWTPLLTLLWLAWDQKRRRDRETRMAGIARAMAQGELPEIVPESAADEALAVMAAALREKEERLAAQLQTIETQNREILQTRERFISQEKLVTLGHLAAGLAHELGNPLSSLFAHVDWLSDSENDPQRRRHFDMMKGELLRMDELLRRLLQLARGGGDASAVCRVQDAVDETVSLLRSQKWCAGVDFRVAADPAALSRTVTADARTILLNLLINAAQAVDGGGCVTIDVQKTQNRIRVTVGDTGPGVAPGLEDRIFEPFFTTKDPGKGTGLGLSVSRMLARRAGGDLICVPGASGGRFELELPPCGGETTENDVTPEQKG